MFLGEVPSLCGLIMAIPLCQLCPWKPPHHSQPPAAAVIAKDIISERFGIEKSGVRFYFTIINKTSLEIKVEDLALLCVIQNHEFPLSNNLPELQTLLQSLKNLRCFHQVSILPLSKCTQGSLVFQFSIAVFERGKADIDPAQHHALEIY